MYFTLHSLDNFLYIALTNLPYLKLQLYVCIIESLSLCIPILSLRITFKSA